jgi:hypothetical protein
MAGAMGTHVNGFAKAYFVLFNTDVWPVLSSSCAFFILLNSREEAFIRPRDRKRKPQVCE